jgi:hypothetical protein
MSSPRLRLIGVGQDSDQPRNSSPADGHSLCAGPPTASRQMTSRGAHPTDLEEVPGSGQGDLAKRPTNGRICRDPTGASFGGGETNPGSGRSYRNCVIDGVLDHSPAEHVRREVTGRNGTRREGLEQPSAIAAIRVAACRISLLPRARSSWAKRGLSVGYKRQI